MKTSINWVQQFRRLVYQSFTKRADASMDLIDALAQADQVESPVAVSVEASFRRQYPSIYDTLSAGQVDDVRLRRVLHAAQPAVSETIAGYKVYAVDATSEERPAAETLADRTLLRNQEREPSIPGHKYSWLARLVLPGRSWVAPLDVRRIESTHKSFAVARAQVQDLDRRSARPKVIVADTGYINWMFLELCLLVQTVVALVRIRNNQVLYGAPVYSGRGRRPKHGPAFRLAAPSLPAERSETLVTVFGATVQLRAWCNLHFQKLPALSGMVIWAQVLKPDGQPRHQRPLWLFWTGPQTVALADLYRMYAWRFTIEHMFRFLKQHLGLNSANVVRSGSPEQWVRLCALAYWHLLLTCDLVTGYVPPWQRQPKAHLPLAWTPRQVQRALHSVSATIGTPARSPRPAGKAPGRAKGFQPQPRPRYPVIRKSRKAAKATLAAVG
jgi:hypothetical protein